MGEDEWQNDTDKTRGRLELSLNQNGAVCRGSDHNVAACRVEKKKKPRSAIPNDTGVSGWQSRREGAEGGRPPSQVQTGRNDQGEDTPFGHELQEAVATALLEDNLALD